MNLQQLEYFVRLAEKEHMTNAARELNTSQPNLSYAMNELEKELGVPLFEKTGRNIKLTRYGSVFYQQIQPALTQISQAEQMIKEMVDPSRGLIRFGFIYTMGAQVAPHLLSSFRELQENNDVDFQFKQANSTRLVEMLKQDQLDIVLTSFIEASDSVHFEALYQEQMVLIVPLEHPLAEYDSVNLKDVSSYPFVYFEKGSGLRPYLDNLFSQLDLKINIAMEAEEDHTVLGFVSHNYGIALLPDIKSIESYPVKKIRILDELPSRWIYLARRKQKYFPPTSQRFYDHCLQQKNLLA